MGSVRFLWSRENDGRFRVQISTAETRAGTFLRLATAMYLLHFDVIEGNLDTVVVDGVAYSEDDFLVEATGDAADPNRLGLLMETLLGEEREAADLFAEHGVRPPEARSFFEASPEILFQDDALTGETQLYIEALGRRGLLYHLASAIARLDINIVRASVRTDESGNAQDTFFLVRNGAAIGPKVAQQLARNILGQDLGQAR